jgi:uncharacterized protein YdiU (UPF0061 family)
MILSPSEGWNFDHTYVQLPAAFYSEINPVPVSKPATFIFNEQLASQLGLHLTSLHRVADLFSGNVLPPNSKPLAQAYAGHQFGHFTMLGDGRAVLLGEHITPTGKRVDIQLKGSGQTPYSRRGDGRATLSAMLREYIISEAMFYLGIPTSRSLAVVLTGDPVYREDVHIGAVLTRIAASHLRVGTFEYAAKFVGKNGLLQLVNYALTRHYPDRLHSPNAALALLKAVMERQVSLICNWMRVGFIHGVMNTDNMSISGETFDYGPCAFMNAYDPATVFSSIDTGGRYAFGNQPTIAHWNLACLAGALLPAIHENQDTAIAQAQEIVNLFPDLFEAKWLEMMGKKMGIERPQHSDRPLVETLLKWMHQHHADYTTTFRMLGMPANQWLEQYHHAGFVEWHNVWTKRIAEQGDWQKALQLMQQNNPVYIPRNHLVEAAINEAATDNNQTRLLELVEVLKKPYNYQQGKDHFLHGPIEGDSNYQTFCGT